MSDKALLRCLLTCVSIAGFAPWGWSQGATQQQPATQQQQPAQQQEQPPPFTAPNPPTPAATEAPGQQEVPGQQMPVVHPDAPLPETNKTTIDFRAIVPLGKQPVKPEKPSPELGHATDTKARPAKESPSAIDTHLLHFIAPYRPARLAAFPSDSSMRIGQLVKDGSLYLSLHDAILLAIENNLDVEIERYGLALADTDVTRAKGGGTLRGLDYTVQQLPPGVGSITSPLLVTATQGTASSTNATVADLSQVTQTGNETQQTLSENGTSSFSAGPLIPLYDPVVHGEASFFRRSDQTSLLNTTTSGGSTLGGSASGTVASTDPRDFVSAAVDYQEGFSTGTALDVYFDNAAQVLYSNTAQLNPFHAPTFSATVTQPLLRGFGREVNLRFVRIANLDRKVSRLLFKQQLLETIYGISRLYYDLVSLGENVGVKEQSLASAQRLYDDDTNQEEEGTLAPIELTRAKALLSSSRLDLIQARGEYRQQEVILRQQILRKTASPAADFATIVPIDHIDVPETLAAIDVSQLTADALANRPDLLQATLQVRADTLEAKASRNSVRPQLNAYANVQNRGSSLTPLQTPGSTGDGIITPPTALTLGGESLSTIYQGGVQLSLPLRNRIAQADSARDAIQLRQAEGRSMKLENDIRQQVENASIALETAHQAYAAAVESVNYQQQLLQAEMDKLSVGESTNYMVIQDQAYLAQARSTEVAARSDWMKAQLSLDRALGNLLEKNNVLLEDAISGSVR
jgi:outer membrane protein TolC